MFTLISSTLRLWLLPLSIFISSLILGLLLCIDGFRIPFLSSADEIIKVNILNNDKVKSVPWSQGSTFRTLSITFAKHKTFLILTIFPPYSHYFIIYFCVFFLLCFCFVLHFSVASSGLLWLLSHLCYLLLPTSVTSSPLMSRWSHPMLSLLYLVRFITILFIFTTSLIYL